ncbi:hypothetical protein [Streptomyces griseoruber]|uniref:Uncharacterized protein n=1 Tax=Streptomyces griseoruber TaxID=1943 RepID=A0A101STR1_9ACTN|nr:hypothetical protein [Streptomyces griseoruber]KUN80015.1 hypothetical protein AQJ64_26720 [Streptomyces griseoruber]
MGIESDQVVYEYLSRVGDVAQQQQLSSATRMRLVSELRNEIDRRRSRATVDSPAAVRRIIDRLGSPDDVVAAAADSGAGAPQAPTPSVPVQRDDEDRPPPAPQGQGRVPGPRSGALADEVRVPDWWQRESDPFAAGDEVPGFVGGVEIPEMLRPPRLGKDQEGRREQGEQGEQGEPQEAGGAAGGEAGAGEASRGRRRLLPALPSGGWSNPLLLLAAVALVVGAVLGKLLLLVAGWAIAYVSRRLTDRETKLAVMWLPGLSVAAGLVWLWGRSEGRWGAPIAEGHMNDAIGETWPWVVRGAAVASALFLVWRSQRRK